MGSSPNLIPKAIYSSVPDLGKVDPRLIDNWKFLEENNPGWTVNIFDNKTCREFIASNYEKRFLKAYDRIEETYGAARADYFRYLLLLERGGIWLDAKTSVLKKIDSIVCARDEFLLLQWTKDETAKANELFWGSRAKIPTSEFLTWCIISKPRHKFLQKVVQDVTRDIETYHPALHGFGGMGVLGTTGPLAYTRSIFPILNDANWRQINIEEECIQYTIFNEIFAHRQVIGTNYRKHIRPVVNRGFFVSSEIVLAWFVFSFRKVLRRFRSRLAK
jgi:mannosyltransferase OCH1-like enzyme